MNHAKYVIIEDDILSEEPLVIKDVGRPWDRHPTITNDAEWVVDDLGTVNLPKGRRLFYIDSDGQMDELLIEDGAFAGFRRGPC